MKAVIYARYSSHAQKETSIEQQVAECGILAKSMGLDIINIYADKAKTGRTSKRAEFQRMIKDSKTKSFSYVITYKNDRFARNRIEPFSINWTVFYSRKRMKSQYFTIF